MDISRVQFQSLRPMLRTKDFDGTIDFYTRHLGFTCDGRSDADGWASLRRDAVGLMVARFPNAHRPFDMRRSPARSTSTWTMPERCGGTLKDHARVCYPMEDFHYGMREFAIFDNNGYLLQFGSPVRA